jgi:hypothetical protein
MDNLEVIEPTAEVTLRPYLCHAYCEGCFSSAPNAEVALCGANLVGDDFQCYLAQCPHDQCVVCLELQVSQDGWCRKHDPNP